MKTRDKVVTDPYSTVLAGFALGAGDPVLRDIVKTVEVDLVRRPNNPGMYYALAMLYPRLKEELPLGFRREIEREKLDAEGIVITPETNPAYAGILAALDHIHMANMRNYLHMKNTDRAVHNLYVAIGKGKDDPAYRDLRNTVLLDFMMDDRLCGQVGFIDLAYGNLLRS